MTLLWWKNPSVMSDWVLSIWLRVHCFFFCFFLTTSSTVLFWVTVCNDSIYTHRCKGKTKIVILYYHTKKKHCTLHKHCQLYQSCIIPNNYWTLPKVTFPETVLKWSGQSGKISIFVLKTPKTKQKVSLYSNWYPHYCNSSIK